MFHDEELHRLIHTLTHKVNRLMSTQDELAAALTAVNGKLDTIGVGVTKIGTETAGLQVEIVTLTAAVAAQGSTTPAVDAALAAVQARVDSLAVQVKTVDDLVPDAPAPPTTPTP